tara:strand:- start:173 stop:289 length:117 start_codon:yes stop_codon:yes gene_type:complete
MKISIKKICKIGATSFEPGFVNQKETKIVKINEKIKYL